MPARNLYVGLDAGGSKTELIARVLPETSAPSSPASFSPGAPAGTDELHGTDEPHGADELHLRGPGANPKRIGMEASAERLADLVRQAMAHRPGARLRSVCAGVAGADSEERRRNLAASLRQALGEAATGAHVHLVHDARIALEAAFGSESGIIVIAGTGSAVFARTEDGTLDRTGGWGYILGDEGSGYALGRAGLRAVARAMDGGEPTLLQALLPEKYGAESRASLICSVYDAEHPLQDAARAVLHAAGEGDAVAVRILDEQTSALARQVAWVVERDGPIAPQIALFGGLTNDAGYVQRLRRAIHGRLPAWAVQAAPDAPVAGALRLALRRRGSSKPALKPPSTSSLNPPVPA